MFEVYDENNNLVGTITTDENGYARLDNLKLQKYTLKEVSSSLSHLIDNNVYEFELVYKDQYTPIITKTFTLKKLSTKRNTRIY
ncbi:MAG: prealbumin-like fold domain-containing protein [Bacilli bacterium]|nr:MAG: prealbumin-like fold domain-containing protein [Bacilli bacterium]